MFCVGLKYLRLGLGTLILVLWSNAAQAGPSDQILLNISVTNTQGTSSDVAFGPVYFAFHNGNFDPFDLGREPSPEFTQQFARDGYSSFTSLDGILTNSNANGVSHVLRNERPSVDGEFQATDSGSFNVVVDRNQQSELFFFSRVLPSNDAFFGSDNSFDLNSLAEGATITFRIVSADIFDADVFNNGTGTADFEAGVFPITPIGESDPSGVSQADPDYFLVFDNIELQNGVKFSAPRLDGFFELGTITITFVATVAEPGMVGIGAIGIFGFVMLRRRQRLKNQLPA